MLYAAPQIRTAAISCRIQPSLLTSCAYSTTTPTPLQSQSASPTSHSPRHRVPIYKRNVSFNLPAQTKRSASSMTTTTTSATTPSTISPAELLDWNTFFKLRKTRRWFQLGSSISTSFGGFVLGAQIITRSDADVLVSQIPLDPMVTLGLITMTCGGVGWLTGPVLGTAAFNLKNRKFRQQMDAKEKEFYARVKKYRVDPSASSMANPVPDYYGEKISSVRGYRQWLKDQRAFNKKRQTYL